MGERVKPPSLIIPLDLLAPCPQPSYFKGHWPLGREGKFLGVREPPLPLEVRAAAQGAGGVWGPHPSLGAVTWLPSHAGRLDTQVRMPP